MFWGLTTISLHSTNHATQAHSNLHPTQIKSISSTTTSPQGDTRYAPHSPTQHATQQDLEQCGPAYWICSYSLRNTHKHTLFWVVPDAQIARHLARMGT